MAQRYTMFRIQPYSLTIRATAPQRVRHSSNCTLDIESRRAGSVIKKAGQTTHLNVILKSFM